MKFSSKLEEYRVLRDARMASPPYATWGAFVDVPGPCGAHFLIIATDGQSSDSELDGWEHVSVSLGKHRRPPNWTEMCFVKDLFWGPEECVVQFHPPRSEYVNNHPGVLHLWRCTKAEFPTPPSIFVGLKSKSEVTYEEAAAISDALTDMYADKFRIP